MATIQIPDEIDRIFEQAAERIGRPKDDFIRDLLTRQAEEYAESEPELTPAQLAHLDRGVAQLRRGEKIPGEQALAKIDRWLADHG